MIDNRRRRWYNPTTGTWTQQDTLDHPLDPANANRYAYAGDDPINGSDPSGNLSKAAQCSIAVAAIGLIIGVLVVATFGSFAAMAATGAAAATVTSAGDVTGLLVGFGIGVTGALIC